MKQNAEQGASDIQDEDKYHMAFGCCMDIGFVRNGEKYKGKASCRFGAVFINARTAAEI